MTPRFKLRTLLIMLAVLPPVIAGFWLWPQTLALAFYALSFAAAAEWVWRNTPRRT